MTPYAEEVNYWHTSKSDPDSWIEKAKRQVETLGATVKAQGFGHAEGKMAYMLGFEIGADKFKVIWPVLPQKYVGNERGAKIQAATMLYHYVKAVCLFAVVAGPKTAFFSHYMLPDGRMAAEVATDELTSMTPRLLLKGAEGKSDG